MEFATDPLRLEGLWRLFFAPWTVPSKSRSVFNHFHHCRTDILIGLRVTSDEFPQRPRPKSPPNYQCLSDLCGQLCRRIFQKAGFHQRNKLPAGALGRLHQRLRRWDHHAGANAAKSQVYGSPSNVSGPEGCELHILCANAPR